MHLHAYRPQDVWDLADRGGLGLDGALAALRDAGVDTVPGTGVKVLSERVRALVAPGDLAIDRWIEGITAAHRAGFRSTSVLFYGHVETAAERIAHLRRLREIQGETGRASPSSCRSRCPAAGGGVPLVSGPQRRSTSTARWSPSRGSLLSGSIPHIQIPWTRVGRDAAADPAAVRAATTSAARSWTAACMPEAGIEHGLELPLPDAARHRRAPVPAVPPAHDGLPRAARRQARDRNRMSRPFNRVEDRSMTRVEVAIVGAGFAGLGMAMALRRAGREDFVVLERAASVGGTWRDNTYPGVACDVPSHLYGFADHPNPRLVGRLTRAATRSARYLEGVVEGEQPRRPAAARAPRCWRPSGMPRRRVWRIETWRRTRHDRSPSALVLACGRLTEPSIPDIAGLETFPGRSSTRRGGTTPPTSPAPASPSSAPGASAVQLVPSSRGRPRA